MRGTSVKNLTRLAAMPAAILIAVFAALYTGAPPIAGLTGPAAAYADEGWQKDFDDVFSKTEGAMALTPEELKALVEKCDKLKPLIEGTDEGESKKKVYLKRLQRTRDYYNFILESKEKK
jgi:hypothetical protein